MRQYKIKKDLKAYDIKIPRVKVPGEKRMLRVSSNFQPEYGETPDNATGHKTAEKDANDPKRNITIPKLDFGKVKSHQRAISMLYHPKDLAWSGRSRYSNENACIPTIKKYSQSNKHLLHLSHTQSKKSLSQANSNANRSFSHHTRNMTVGAGSPSKELLSQLMQRHESSDVKIKSRDILINAYSNVKSMKSREKYKIKKYINI